MKRFILCAALVLGCNLLCHCATFATTPNLYIRAVNPGYTIDGASNSGELIELATDSTESIPLGGLSIRYTNSSGNANTLIEFPDGSQMTGSNLILRLASSPESSQSDLTYTKTLAFSAGPLELIRGDETISTLCWTGKNDCYAKFTSAHPTTLVYNSELSAYEHLEDYTPIFDSEHPSYLPPPTPENIDEVILPQCRGLQFSEILSYYETQQSEQFIEFFNPTDHQILLDGCLIKYKNKTHPLSGIVEPEGYFVRYVTDFSLTKNPTSSNTIALVDVDGSTVDDLTYHNGQKKAVAYAQFGYNTAGEENWLGTYHATPGEANDFQQYKTCEDGKVLNESTGNCVKPSSTATTECPAGKYRNPLTGRCKSYPTTTSTLQPCAEGYERNPETNRCRKIKQNTGADYPIVAESHEEKSSFIALGAILIIVALALVYIVFQFRHEIANFFRKLKLKFRGGH